MAAEVVDPSVLGAFLFQEARAEEAASLLENTELFEPELLAHELASIARKKALRHPELRAEILQAFEVGLSLNVHWVRVDQIAIVELALETGLTTCDASYLYLARTLDIPLVTFDEELRSASEP